MSFARRIALVGAACAALALLAPGCGDPEAAGAGGAPDGDVDADVDADGDADADGGGEADTGAEGDADSGADTDAAKPGICATNANCAEEFCDQVLISAGEYPRGSDVQPEDPEIIESCVDYGFGDETPRHDVHLDAFCIDKYEVTRRRYDACVDAGACPVPANWEDWTTDDWEAAHMPIVVAGFAAAEAYCTWIGRRMCTEAEWERAANGPGPEKRTYPWGESTGYLDSLELFWGVGGMFVPVDSFSELASAEGVYGLASNALELVADRYAPYEAPDGGVLDDPVGPPDGELRLARGGASWIPSAYTTTERIILPADASQANYAFW